VSAPVPEWDQVLGQVDQVLYLSQYLSQHLSQHLSPNGLAYRK